MSNIVDLTKPTIFRGELLEIVECEIEPIDLVEDIDRLLVQISHATQSQNQCWSLVRGLLVV